MAQETKNDTLAISSSPTIMLLMFILPLYFSEFSQNLLCL
jgi:hypothetical protein